MFFIYVLSLRKLLKDMFWLVAGVNQKGRHGDPEKRRASPEGRGKKIPEPSPSAAL